MSHPQGETGLTCRDDGIALILIAESPKKVIKLAIYLGNPGYEDYVAQAGVADRLRFYPGSFFDDPLPAADVLVMGHILHDWDIDEKMLLLAKAHDALPVGGALIVYENLIDDERATNIFGLLMSLNMLIETQGGFDFTGADCTGWMRTVGFSETRVEHLTGPAHMVIGIK